jgi:diaminohydroxyphosphoribosylaminopyrimidine deaminase/5-amino-6-(5-phosphoribosylamino)uracil reductase
VVARPWATHLTVVARPWATHLTVVARDRLIFVEPLERAVQLGVQGLGTTSPNPSVGCVLTDSAGDVVGEGRTEPAGGRHAEIVALDAAGERARGATAWVTLEPCAHRGRTGPCADALIAAGVVRVVYLKNDLVNGGSNRLREAGVEVEQSGEGGDYLIPWLHATELKRPYVTWKVATTIDGRTAAPDGSSRWITGPDARERVHLLRSQVDAVIVGSGTVIADNPELTDRRPEARHQPRRIVLDRSGRIPPAARVHPATVMSGSPSDILEELFRESCRHVLLEGGATVAGSFLDADLIDEVVWFTAPLMLGAGVPALITSARTLTDAGRWQIHDVSRVGNDVRTVYRRVS